MSALSLRFVPDGYDQIGQLWFDVEDTPFQGSGFFWSDLSEMTSFVEKLQAFPLSACVSQRWGYDKAVGQDAVLSLAFEPAGPTGGLTVAVVVADLYNLKRRLSASLQTDYASLDRLLTELRVLVQRREGAAFLQGV